MDTNKINFKRSRKKSTYKRVANEKRQELISLINEGMKMREAASRLDLNYSTAKTIFRIYRIEKRCVKKNAEEEGNLKKILEKNSFDRVSQISKCKSQKKLQYSSQEISIGSTDSYSDNRNRNYDCII